MIRLIFVLAIAYGIFWFGTNFDFSAFKAKSIETFKNEKTVNIVNKTRLETQTEIDEILK